MFIKIIGFGESMYECDSYNITGQCNSADGEASLNLILRKSNAILTEQFIEKNKHKVFIMNNEGKTIDTIY